MADARDNLEDALMRTEADAEAALKSAAALAGQLKRAKKAAPDVWMQTGYVADGNLLLRAARDQAFKPPVLLWVGVGDTADTLDAVVFGIDDVDPATLEDMFANAL